jgi:hypothetical protein
VETITRAGLRLARPDAAKSDAAEAEELIEHARSRDAKNILAMIKGLPNNGQVTRQDEGWVEELGALSRKKKVPIIIVGVERAFYSFAEAIRTAMKIKECEGKNGWAWILPPLRNITAEIEADYQKYQQSLIAMVAA